MLVYNQQVMLRQDYVAHLKLIRLRIVPPLRLVASSDNIHSYNFPRYLQLLKG